MDQNYKFHNNICPTCGKLIQIMQTQQKQSKFLPLKVKTNQFTVGKWRQKLLVCPECVQKRENFNRDFSLIICMGMIILRIPFTSFSIQIIYVEQEEDYLTYLNIIFFVVCIRQHIQRIKLNLNKQFNWYSHWVKSYKGKIVQRQSKGKTDKIKSRSKPKSTDFLLLGPNCRRVNRVQTLNVTWRLESGLIMKS